MPSAVAAADPSLQSTVVMEETNHSDSTVETEIETSLPINFKLFVEIPKNEDVAFSAVRYGDLTTLERRLREGFEINTQHNESPGDIVYTIKDMSRMVRPLRLKKYTVLCVAVCHSQLETIHFLLSHGADVNQVAENGISPLAVASAIQRPDVVDLLIKGGAILDTQSSSGRTPLIQAVNNKDLTTTQLLISAGADLDLADIKDATPLFTCLLDSKLCRIDILRALLQGGCKVDRANKQGATPLMTAVGVGNREAVQALLDAGADINMIDKAGKTVFHMSVGVNTSLFLINNGASSDHPDKQDKRPLDYAASVGHISMMRLLLSTDCQRSTAILDVPRVIQACQSLPIFDKWLHQELYNPRNLKRLCRQTIRESLSPSNTARVSELPIPGLLKDFLLAKHIDLSFNNVTEPEPFISHGASFLQNLPRR